ncbi:MAG TPA: hypothetical protein VHY35_16370 [Stellaceae bacterium]|jgi:hypothetical protein|nr:hypothetical protein [Stellaceae bacterium]
MTDTIDNGLGTTQTDTQAEPGTRHAYPTGAMAGDYARAAAGLVPTGVLLATVPIGAVAGTLLGGFAAVFGIFGLRTALRHATRLEMTDTGLRTSGALHRAIGWGALDRLKLAYYSTRRDRSSGWMQLELGAGRIRVGLDSRIDGFDRLVQRAAEAATANGVEMSDATMANLEALGIRLPETKADG